MIAPRAVRAYGPRRLLGPGKAATSLLVGRGQARKRPGRARGQAASTNVRVTLFPWGHISSSSTKGLPKTRTTMEPADEELQQLTAPPARTSNNKARAVVACVALASTALLFAVTQKTPKGTSPAVLAAREVVKQQIQDRDTTPGAGPHGPGDADVTHDVDSCSDPCIP